MVQIGVNVNLNLSFNEKAREEIVAIELTGAKFHVSEEYYISCWRKKAAAQNRFDKIHEIIYRNSLFYPKLDLGLNQACLHLRQIALSLISIILYVILNFAACTGRLPISDVRSRFSLYLKDVWMFVSSSRPGCVAPDLKRSKNMGNWGMAAWML